MITHLVTHSGTFHGDDVLAYTLLHDLYPSAALVRTRDQAKLDSLAGQAITFDIGNAYDPLKQCYDHHQPNPPRREDGTPYSAVGLIWQHFGQDWLRTCAQIPEALVEGTHRHMDRAFILRVDQIDNGVIDSYHAADMDITSMIFRANPPTMDLEGNAIAVHPTQQDEAFKRIAGQTRPFLHAYAQNVAQQELAVLKVAEAMEQRPNKRVLVLETGMPWNRALFQAKSQEDVLLVAFPSSPSEWALQCAPTEPGSLMLRRGFPESWRGLRGAEMEAASNTPGAIFCHTAGFFAATTSRDSALALAEKTLETWRQEDRKSMLNARAADSLAPKAEKRWTPPSR
jgi:uncharacterized UPF0160 family protein